ncbi:MAG: SpoIIE family protein phosphatase [Candidatus Aminicenantes bacterium]|nr:MAG: SpoIIE family protein phosphatase [Candidatus Aminicenantes bacterium]
MWTIFSRWRKVDVLIALLVGLTVVAYVLFNQAIFKLFLWVLAIAVLIRLLIIVKKSLWKIRNRLIFSGVFLVVTPIFLIILFFWFIGNVIITQYGTVIMENMLNDRLNTAENIANTYLLYNNSRLMRMAFSIQTRLRIPYFNAVFWEKTGDTYRVFFKHPQTFDTKKLVIEEFKDYFLLNDKLYHGVLRTSNNHAVLIALEINQVYLDSLSNISDFSLKYRNPNVKYSEPGTNSPGPVPLTSVDDYSDISFLTFEYTFLDFNTQEDSKPVRRYSDFLISSDKDKIYKKIKEGIFNSPRGSTRKLIYVLIALFGTFIIISLFIGFRMVRVITRSLNQLTNGTQRIRNGDFSFRIRTRSGDQMQYLAESFNEMAAGIDRLLVDEKEKQRLEEELRIARSIQLKLLPAESFQTDEFEIAAANIPAAEIAGDYFDYFYQPDDYLSLFVADVSGKGASAAFYMAELKGVINHLYREVMSPAALIAECHDSMENSLDKATFITMNMAQFRISEKKFLFARAGHTQAIFFNAKEKKCVELYPEGVAIGLINFTRKKIKEIEMPYQKGDILFLFSDGLSEIMNENDEVLGVDQLKRLIHKHHHLPVEEIKQKILDFSIQFSESSISRDDLTFIVLKVK